MKDKISRLIEVAKECADELEEWVENHYPYEIIKYPGMLSKYNRDINPVHNIRNIIKEIENEP